MRRDCVKRQHAGAQKAESLRGAGRGNYTYVNKRSGEVQSIPKGVDPGFNYAPGGRLANLQKMLTDKINLLPESLKKAANEHIKITGI